MNMKNVVIVDSVRTGLAKSHRGGFNMTNLGVVSCTTPALAGSGDVRSGVMHYPKCRPGFEWMQYAADFPDADDRLHRTNFNKVWKQQLRRGWK